MKERKKTFVKNFFVCTSDCHWCVYMWFIVNVWPNIRYITIIKNVFIFQNKKKKTQQPTISGEKFSLFFLFYFHILSIWHAHATHHHNIVERNQKKKTKNKKYNKRNFRFWVLKNVLTTFYWYSLAEWM